MKNLFTFAATEKKIEIKISSERKWNVNWDYAIGGGGGGINKPRHSRVNELI